MGGATSSPAATAVFLVHVFALVGSGGASKLRANAGSATGNFVYDYSKHGQDWLQGSCASRQRQSPIDLPVPTNPVPTAQFKYTYDLIKAPFELVNNGHTLSADLRNQGYGGISFGDAWYDLMYLNVHAMAEHTIGGVRKPLELHMVHKRYDSDALLVVAVTFDSAAPPPVGGTPLQMNNPAYEAPPLTDPNSNPVLQAILRVPPPPPMFKALVPGDAVVAPDLGNLIAGANFFGYGGSTTAPPCAENVAWLVRSTPVFASDTQVRWLYDAIYSATAGQGNYRTAMPLNRRDIMLYGAIRSPAPSVDSSAAMAAASVSSSAKADPEYLSRKWARDAMRVAAASLDYVRNLDMRLHRAAHASSAALEPKPILEDMAAPSAATTTTTGAPVDPQGAAVNMAAIVAQAAQHAIQNASATIAAQAHEAAIKAAQEATDMVKEQLNERDKASRAAMEKAVQQALMGSITIPH